MKDKNYSLPPKTCSIERLITIPADIDRVINGEKTATRRNGRYADIDEVMVLKDRKFIITDVYPQKLGDVTDEHALQEGFQNLEEYKQSILSIHPSMKWKPEIRVWVHEFEAAE
ncbi:ASCH domain-containing protein [Virgibacillus saliphilus]|uniref:ASCH domain-containing protein n=1 Tax=Virgibacillus saliphilus TaxID=2831674 RepID=UPI00210854BA